MGWVAVVTGWVAAAKETEEVVMEKVAVAKVGCTHRSSKRPFGRCSHSRRSKRQSPPL